MMMALLYSCCCIAIAKLIFNAKNSESIHFEVFQNKRTGFQTIYIYSSNMIGELFCMTSHKIKCSVSVNFFMTILSIIFQGKKLKI